MEDKKTVLEERSRQGRLIALPKSFLDIIRRVKNAEMEMKCFMAESRPMNRLPTVWECR